MSSAPFFFVGASHSGTTMLRLMLAAHSRLGMPDELKYLQSIRLGLERNRNQRGGGIPVPRRAAEPARPNA